MPTLIAINSLLELLCHTCKVCHVRNRPRRLTACMRATGNVEVQPQQQNSVTQEAVAHDAVAQKRVTGASLPALMLSTAQAVELGSSQGFGRSGANPFYTPMRRCSTVLGPQSDLALVRPDMGNQYCQSTC